MKDFHNLFNEELKEIYCAEKSFKDLLKDVCSSASNQELKKGIKVEMEHTSKRSVAKEIALDHLGERLDYYTKLSKVEKS